MRKQTVAAFTLALLPLLTLIGYQPPTAAEPVQAEDIPTLEWVESVPDCSTADLITAYDDGFDLGKWNVMNTRRGSLATTNPEWFRTGTWLPVTAENTCYEYGITQGWNSTRTANY